MKAQSFYRSLSQAGSLLTAVTLLAACSSDSDSNGVELNYAAAVQTAVYGSGSALQFVDLEATTLEASAASFNEVDTDYTVSAYGEHFYHIGRNAIDTIAKYSITDSSSQIFEYATRDQNQSTSNTYKMVHVDENKAFLINWAHDAIWIVNPQAATEQDFKIGEIDISAYAVDGSANAVDGLVVNNQLFVVLQRLDSASIPQSGYVAVFDLSNNHQEIDTNPNDDASNLKGIALAITNLDAIQSVDNTAVFVQGSGDIWGAAFYARANAFSSGVVKIATTDYAQTLVIDDGLDDNNESHPYGHITSFTLLDANNGFFVGTVVQTSPYASLSSLYHFNPSNGNAGEAINGFSDIDIALLATSPLGNAWVGIHDSANPRIVVVDASETVQATIAFELNPIAIGFTAKAATATTAE